MSYLASILARADGTAPVLQPRLASRYEQVVRNEVPPMEISQERAAEASPAVDVPAPVAATPRAEPAPPAAVAPPREIVHTRDAEPGRVEIRHREHTTSLETSVEKHHHSERVIREEHVITKAEPAPAPPPSPRVVEARTPAAEEQKTNEPSEAPLRALLLPRPAAPSPAAARPDAAPRGTIANDAAPTIRVTIGRVDVRAVEPQSRPSRPASARAPAFTLEDYVRLRREGRRS